MRMINLVVSTKEISLLSNISKDKESNFYIGKDTFHDNNFGPIKPNRHTFYEIMFILEGEGVHYIDFQEYKIQKGMLFLISPSQVHHWDQVGRLEQYMVRFDESIFFDTTFFENCSVFNFDSLFLQNDKYDLIESSFYDLHNEFKMQKTWTKKAIACLLKLLLIRIRRVAPVENHSNKNIDLFGKLNNLIHQNGYKIEKPNIYAKQMKVQTKQLNEVIKEFSGMNCGEYIRLKTILEAKRLFIHTTLTSNEISFQLGFVDSAYFSRFFKRETGVTPKEFKKGYT